MSGFRPFTRQLGFQPGVQLNPLADNTDGVAPDNSDQVFATIARLSRGRIDRPFKVNRSNLLSMLGAPASIRTNGLNEGKLQIYEGLNNGGYECVVQRLAPASATKSYAVIDMTNAATAFSVSASAPVSNWSIAVLDHACYNDGITVAVHADSTPLGGTAVSNKELTLRVMDASGTIRHEFTGSVDPAAVDDFGASYYLPDIVSGQTDEIEVLVSTTFSAVGVLTTSDGYGRGSDGRDQWVTSSVLTCFNEGGTIYAATDYDRCIEGLRNTTIPFGYLISGGTQALSFLGKLVAFAVEINTTIKVDLNGRLTPAAAIAMMQSLNIDTHYAHVYWAPIEADDPMNGGKVVWGTAGLNVGFSCARNAQINAKGFAPKNWPVAGSRYPLNRTGIRQLYKPTEQELSDLAKAQINPVIFEIYNGGGKTVFTDSLTSAKTRVSYKKLISVAEMSASLDNWVTTYSKELLQLPMSEFIKRMDAFLDILLSDAQASGWLVPSKKLPGNAAYQFKVQASEVRPADLVLIDYWTSYDGVARQVIVQQTLTR
jgi:hypothetical protein